MAALAERQIARSAGTVMVGFGLSSLLGLANRMLYTRAFGSGQELDAFFAANRVPDILFNLMAGGALASAFLPTFAALLAQGDRARAWRLASGVGNLLILALGLAAVLVGLAAPWLVENILGRGFNDPQQIQLTVRLLRIQLVAPVIFGISGLVMAILNAKQQFLLPALAPTFYWLGWILGSLFLVPRLGISGLAWGVLVGALLHLSIQLPGLRRMRPQYAATFGLKDSSVRMVGRLMAPRLFGVAIVQLNFLVNVILASGMAVGSLTGITLGFAIMLMPQIVIAQAVAIAALPTFSSQAAKGELAEMRRSLASSLRGVIFLSLPASVGLILLRVPLVTLLFQRGEFDSNSTELVAWAVLWYSTGLVGHCLVEIVSRAFYALKDTRTPVTVGAAAMALNVVLSIGLSRLFLRLGWPPHGGLALANSIATGLEAIALLWLASRRLEGIEIARIRPGIAASLLATAAMGFGLMLWLAVTEGSSAWVVALGGVGLGAAAYWLASLGLRSPEARQLPGLILARR
jgi:putative peptidoglycan lipid II flippase